MKTLILFLILSSAAHAQTPTPTPVKIPNPINPCLMDSTGKPSLAAWKLAHCS